MTDTIGPRTVVGTIEPIQIRDIAIDKLAAPAPAIAPLMVPSFAYPPDIVPGSELTDDDDNPIPGTGLAVPETVRATPATRANAGILARRVMAGMHSLPMTREACELMTLAVSILHYENTLDKLRDLHGELANNTGAYVKARMGEVLDK